LSDKQLSAGPFTIDAARGAVTRDGRPIALGQRAVALLAALAEAGGAPVSKAGLMERAWPGTMVEEGNLTVQIAALRKALGSGEGGHDWIATVPRIGYRLTLPRTGNAAEADLLQPALAVLPFQNLGGDPEQDWFADGVVEDIITALSRFTSFAVIARNSSFAYKGRAMDVRQVAKELGVRYVLEGSVRRSGNKLRIAAQLVDGTSGANLWARNLDGVMDDVFGFQDEITASVAAVVGPSIEKAEMERSRRDRPGSVASYDIYLRARSRIQAETESQNRDACAFLLEALSKEPNNAGLLAFAAWTFGHRVTMGWPPLGPDDREKCIAFARRGLEVAAGDATVLAHCGIALVEIGREYDRGMAVLDTAAGVAHLHCGSVEKALSLFHRSCRLSPADPMTYIALGGIAHAHMILESYEEALTWALRAVAINQKYDPAYWMLVAAHAHCGRLAEARRYLDELLELAPELTIARLREGQAAKDPSRLAAILDGLRIAGLPEG
jgi:TolB-like protein